MVTVKINTTVTIQAPPEQVEALLKDKRATIVYYTNDKGDYESIQARIVGTTAEVLVFENDGYYAALDLATIESITEE